MLAPPFAALYDTLMRQEAPAIRFSSPFPTQHRPPTMVNRPAIIQSRPLPTPHRPLPTPHKPIPSHLPFPTQTEPIVRNAPKSDRRKALAKPNERHVAIFQEFVGFASVSKHSALASTPPSAALRNTFQFLQSRSMRILWKRGDIKAGCAKLALRLDTEWPEWALSRTNVFGLLLSEIFDEFYYYLEDQPNNAFNNGFFVEFEKHLMLEAEYRHRSEWWSNRRLRPSAWCNDGAKGDTIIYPGHPFHVPKGVIVSWRRFHLVMVARRLKAEDATKEGYVYI
ncbi:hypothetical protein FRC09_006753 [Ceratobasidium sp. 395]|nr:hypothetical protein FRC09_006753 [Ceratobasidium sp. 395]